MPSATYPASPLFTVQPLSASLRKDTLIGAEILTKGNAPIDPAAFSTEDTSILKQALYDNSVIVFRKQQGIDPLSLEKLAAIWDEDIINVHSGGCKQIADPKNILSRNNGVRLPGVRLPGAPNVQIIGNGKFEDYEGLNLNLRHVNSSEFHAEPLTREEIENGQTRFYRWHLDAPLYENLPGKVTLIHGLVVPKLPEQKIKFPNGEFMELQAGATAFVSGARAFQLLSPEEQEFALNTTIQYAPRAYEWIRDCKATADGLGIEKVGHERSVDDLPEWTWDQVQALPMVWKNPGHLDQPHLQILGCCVHSLHTKDPKLAKSL